jgi:pimeloyl-ACP methyl ester carboxylesterase
MKIIVSAALVLASALSTTMSFAASSSVQTALPRVSTNILATAVNYNTLDHGLYFFATNKDAQKWTGAANANFDPAKPTMIYIHGWQKGSTQKQTRETFERLNASTNDDFASIWRTADLARQKASWNVGICYWNQFADENEVKDAEAKVWSAQGPQGMRWRKADGSYSTATINVSAGTMCANAIASAMGNFSGSQLRLVGHSLGSQMVINVAQQLSDKVDANQLPVKARPGRVALLDPAFLQGARSYLNNRWPGEVARGIVSYLKTKGVIFEAYRSSGSTSNGFIGDANYDLLKMCAFTELSSSYYGSFDFAAKHEMAVWWYLWSMAFAAPTNDLTASSHPASSIARSPSASTEDYRVNAQMNSALKSIHQTGQDTRTPQGDTFRFETK